MIEATLLLLAGGSSSRMGQPKALLPVGGSTLLEWMIGRFGDDFDDVLVSARDLALVPSALHKKVVLDATPGDGPLAGIAAGLRSARNGAVMALACDMPYVTNEVLSRLVLDAVAYDAAVPEVAGRPEPVCGCYRKSSLKSIEGAIAAGELRAASVLGRLRVRWLRDANPAIFASLNTPAEYRRFLAGL
jgi:molybdopterin-guanine dinucleotide biosynthesis protein A